MTSILDTLLGADLWGIQVLDKINGNFVKRNSLDDTAVTTTYDALDTDHIILCDATGGAFTVNLLAVATAVRRALWIVKTDASGNAVTVDGAGSEKINNATTQSLASRYSSIRIYPTATEWIILAKNL